ncbi:MAG TPA: vWA domain-containing protein, partial [Kofleriaceae bacterium]|nr:vWA domain-containing protein [Kofleriaceae bacterium]
ACDPTPGAANTCPSGYHCSPDGKCDLQCTQGGGECPDGDSCSSDGYCNQGSNTPPDVDANCPAVHFTPTPTIPSIELVLDRSGSMSSNKIGNQTRYQVLHDALFTANTGAVAKAQASVYFGEELFAGDQTPCTDGPPGSLYVTGYSAPRALNNSTALETLTTSKPPNNGATPTSAAIDTAVKDFMTTPPPAGSPPILLLATDGEPNSCGNGNDNGRSVNSTTTAYNNGIRTFIIGFAGVNTAFLQQVANAGVGMTNGNAPYYTASDPASLVTAFNSIINGVISCDLTINQMVDPASAPGASVTLNGMNLTYGTDWTLDPNGMTIHILGSACTTLKNTPNAVVDAAFPCGSVIF